MLRDRAWPYSQGRNNPNLMNGHGPNIHLRLNRGAILTALVLFRLLAQGHGQPRRQNR